MTSKNNENSDWLEKQQTASRRTKWYIIGGLAVAAIIIIIGVSVGVTVSKNHKNNNLSSGSSGSSSGGSGGSGSTPAGYVAIPGTAGVVKANPKDPSQFAKDPRLIRSFYGFAYTPLNVQMPSCGAVQVNVTEDIQLMSQLTNRIRLYGADCNQSSLVLEAVKQTKVDMQVFLAIYVDGTNATYTRQKAVIKQTLLDYGTDNIAGIAIGNEYMLNSVGDGSVTGAAGVTAATYLGSLIADFRAMLASMNLKKSPPVGTADAGAYFNVQLLDYVDYAMSNVHPWFGNVSITDAAAWTYDFFNETNLAMSAQTTTNPTWYIAETGWPTKSSSAAAANDGPSIASVPNLQIFLDTFVCQSNTNGTKYFFFEYFDEAWKDVLYGGVEGWWGLFDGNKNLKNVTIPNCPISS